MKTRGTLTSVFVAFTMLAVGMAAYGHAQQAVSSSIATADDELVQILIQGSPWSGPWRVLNPGPNIRFPEGTAVIVFEQKGAHLTGRLVETTCESCPTGDLMFVRVKNGKLEYRTPSGIDFTMTYRPDKNLEGEGARPRQRQVTKMLLCHSGKACPKEVEP